MIFISLISLLGISVNLVSASSILRVGIQKNEDASASSLLSSSSSYLSSLIGSGGSTSNNNGSSSASHQHQHHQHHHHHSGQCDGSILSELLKEELWTWAHAEIQSFIQEDDFELGELELDVLDATPLEQLLWLSNTTGMALEQQQLYLQQSSGGYNVMPEAVDARSTKNSNSNDCNSNNGLCHRFRAPLTIPSLSKTTTTTTTSTQNQQPYQQQRTRGGGSLQSRMASRIQKSLYKQIPTWMSANRVLIGTSCAKDASKLQVSVEIIVLD